MKTHGQTTGCNLSFEDFDGPYDESCADGGRPLEHPRIRFPEYAWENETTITIRHEGHDAEFILNKVEELISSWGDSVGPITIDKDS